MTLPNTSEHSIYCLSGICAFLAIISFIVPGFVSNPEGGFATGASAVLVFLAMLVVTLLISLLLLSMTIHKYNRLSKVARIAGIVPGIIVTAALIGLFGFLSY